MSCIQPRYKIKEREYGVFAFINIIQVRNMFSDELKDIVDHFNKQGRMNFLDGATGDQIAVFEKEHEIKLSLKFKE